MKRAQIIIILAQNIGRLIYKNGCKQDSDGGKNHLSPFIGTGNILFSAEVMNMLALVPENAVRKERELVGLFEYDCGGERQNITVYGRKKVFQYK